jgi:SNF2 family DNA or RNA helicase
LIKDAFKGKRSVIVWTSYNDTSVYLKRFIQHALPKAESYLVNGTISLQKRNEQINRFKQCKLGVLVATIGTCKEGLNLQNASLAIFVDSTYKLDDFLQAQDRIHRLNQKRDCQVIQLIYKSTIEVWINRLLALKHHVAKDVFDNSESISLPLAEQLFSEKDGIFNE